LKVKDGIAFKQTVGLSDELLKWKILRNTTVKDKHNEIKFINVLYRGNEVQQEAIVCAECPS